MVAMCAGPESGHSSTAARASSASSCGSVSLADLIDHRHRCAWRSMRSRPSALERGAAAAQDHAHAVRRTA
jgi:hypothetical protein